MNAILYYTRYLYEPNKGTFLEKPRETIARYLPLDMLLKMEELISLGSEEVSLTYHNKNVDRILEFKVVKFETKEDKREE